MFGQLEPDGFKVCFERSFKFTRLEEMMLSVKDEKTPANSSQNPFQYIFIISFFRKEDEIRGMISFELSNELIHSV